MGDDAKRILVGVTGCIAAYKSAEIVRGLQKRGFKVKVVMTEHATRFVDPVTFRALTNEKVPVTLFDDPADPIHHISLAEECDLFLIAPCTANVAAKIACGIADDLLTTTALACTAPMVVAPAMNVHMYEAAVTRQNLKILRERGIHVIDADAGYLACGDVGSGRLPEPEAIVEAVEGLLKARHSLEGRRIVVTAGPTVEPIDSVRFVSNRSSGKTGYAIAEEAARRGAEVVLISGPVALDEPAGIQTVQVQTAQDMLQAAQEAFGDADAVICCAAVADYRPAHPADRKLKKGADDGVLESIEMVRNPDILATLGAARKPGQKVVGFAAETDDVVANGIRKLESKHADLIVANDVGGGKVFGRNTTQVVLIDAEGPRPLDPMAKTALAGVLCDELEAMLS